MATEIDELIVQISADTRGLKTELGRVKDQLNNAFPEGNRSPVGKMGAALRGLVGPLAAVATGFGAIAAVRGIAAVGDEFEALNITLGRIYGGTQEGLQAFDDITDFAATTPFQIQDVTKAFIQLKSNGIEPSTDMLTTFGDAASAAMNPLEAFNSLIRITQRAAGGGLGLEELEQLVNQGLPVYSILREELGKSRLELSELGKTAEGASTIMTALQKGLKEEFGGIMGQRMDLLSTKTSNLQDAFSKLQGTLFAGGLDTLLKSLTDRMTGFLTRVREAIQAAREAAALSDNLPASVRTALMMEGRRERGVGGHGGRQARQAISVEQAIADARNDLDLRRKELTDQITKSVDKLSGQMKKNADRSKERAREGLQQIELEIAALDRLALSRQKAETVSPVGADPDDAPMSTRQIEAIAAMRKELEGTVTAAEELDVLIDQFGEAAATGSLTTEEIVKLNNHLAAMGEEITLNKLEEEFGDLQSIISKTVDPADELAESIAAIQKIIDEGDKGVLNFLFGDRSPEEIQAVMDQLGNDLKDIGADTEETAKSFKNTLAPAIQQISLAFTNEFVNALLTGQNALDSFKSFARNIVSQIISIFLQLAVVNRILNLIFGKNTFSELNFGGGIGKFEVTPGKGLASGGSMMRGKPYLVGERGPELFVPSVAGTLRSGNDTRGMMGGGPPIIVNQSLNFSTGVVPTVRAEVQRMLPQISETTKASVLEATRRGGSYRRGLLGA